ncbi:MAG: hypothetical protein H5U02_07725 [Clostridia bacterium]|nr:hypothetical protein [Clostridia bacterium]
MNRRPGGEVKGEVIRVEQRRQRILREPELDHLALSQKYRVDVRRIIRAWKAGKSDAEIAAKIDISTDRLELLRAEILEIHRRQRLDQPVLPRIRSR